MDSAQVRDTGTRGVAAAMALSLIRRGAARPHLLVCHLVRSRLDVNRAREDAATYPVALYAWDCYHELLESARRAASAVAPQCALFVDVHAQANWRFHGVDAIELGTLCPCAKDLQLGSDHLDQLGLACFGAARVENGAGVGCLEGAPDDPEGAVARLAGIFTMPRLANQALLRGGSLSQLLLGPRSLGALLDRRGFRAIPSPTLQVPPPTLPRQAQPDLPAAAAARRSRDLEEPSEGEEGLRASELATHFFCGSASYPLRTSPAVLDAVQLECPVRLTKDRRKGECS